MNSQDIDLNFVPATGGVDVAKYRRDDVDDLRKLKVDSDLDRHIVQLLALHPALRVQFRNQDLTALDDATKLQLLHDMNQVLGIKPLKNPVQ
ncbi:MAG: hypothetical protein KDA44_02105 [Planctomycetales bacterium]|nr:hypothetical protein [Planctomycetales bacterium]